MSDKNWSIVKDTFQVVFFALILTFVLRSFVIEAFQIPSGSMIPTLQIGDRLLVDKIVTRFTGYDRGDIIVFMPPPQARTPETGDSDYIKRLIGLPGDKIEVVNGVVKRNDEPLNEPYINEKPAYNFGPVTVPEGMYFVMGDNRNNSFDSHEWGFLPQENVRGKAIVRFWPLNRMGTLN